MAQVLSNIDPTLSYGEADFADVDVVVEAVVENPKIKKIVLAEVEQKCKEGTVLCSNTSTISITSLAEGLEHPEKTSAACTSSIQLHQNETRGDHSR